MKVAHWLWCAAALLALVVGPRGAGVSTVSALVIAALLACPLIMLITMSMTNSNSVNYPETSCEVEPSRSSLPANDLLSDREEVLR
jgi:hypothetical protein